jgi:hypothetical protein
MSRHGSLVAGLRKENSQDCETANLNSSAQDAQEAPLDELKHSDMERRLQN